VLALRVENLLPRLEPLDRQRVLGIGEARAGLPRARALVVLVVRHPGDLDDPVHFGRRPVERRVVEVLAIAALELGAAQLDVGLALADGRVRHGGILPHPAPAC
jgi:hypothetical protein